MTYIFRPAPNLSRHISPSGVRPSVRQSPAAR
jgi:hypothetical protein